MLELEKLLASARRKTGLDDYGDDDFLEPLGRLIDALNQEAGLNNFGRYRAEANILGALANRLKIEDYIRQHPDVLEQQIEQPVFIVGLPRTGTTALHHLLNQDERNHTLRMWEGSHPVPPPEQASYHSDPRIAQVAEGIGMTEQFMPGFMKTHLLDAEEPDECFLLFNRNFMSVEYSALFRVPSFMQWLFAQDLTGSYAYHKRQLQLLQYRKPGRWVLKSPYHQLGLAAILMHYPDALIVQTHRAPISIVGSGCSFSEVLKRPSTDDLDLNEVGREWLGMLETYTNSFEATRERLEPEHPGQFIDLYYDAFVTDPLVAIAQIYQRLDQEISAPARSAMQEWLSNNRQGKHGSHEYSLDKYGIERQQVEQVFSAYVEKYGLSWE